MTRDVAQVRGAILKVVQAFAGAAEIESGQGDYRIVVLVRGTGTTWSVEGQDEVERGCTASYKPAGLLPLVDVIYWGTRMLRPIPNTQSKSEMYTM